ncbi:MAG TPA: di-heme oxidoredictase family protein [Flavipsychrobacter sp.]
MKRILYVFIVILGLQVSCKKFEPVAPEEHETLDGPLANLTDEQRAIFLRGDRAFNNDIFTKETGLGPLFVSTSCGSCHAGDGKGHPFTTLTRFGQVDEQGNLFSHAGGPQLQNRAIPGHLPETIPTGATFSKFTPPANSGLGYLDAVTDADILAMADPNDADGDGISGTPNWVVLKDYITPRQGSIIVSGKHIGRFGKKGAAYNLLQQTAAAYNQDMGITSTYEPYDTYSNEEIDPEVSNQTIQDVVFYLRTLKAPIPRTPDNANVLTGKNLFAQVNCNKCHASELKTGTSTITALSNQTFMPYTDLLLHDMGKGLDDGYTEGSAKTYEWRTPPLWGLGLSKISQGGTYYLLHDGRARNIEEAILLHGGEAANSITSYKALSSDDKKKLIAFLESL